MIIQEQTVLCTHNCKPPFAHPCVALLTFLKAESVTLHFPAFTGLGLDSVARKAFRPSVYKHSDHEAISASVHFPGTPVRKASGQKCSYNKLNLKQYLNLPLPSRHFYY